MSTSKIQCASCEQTTDRELLAMIGELAKGYAAGGSLIQALHMAQGLYGHLPLQVQQVVADAMGMPVAQVSGVVSFYSYFTTKPRGRHTIRVCLGTACYVRGGKKIVDRLGEELGIGVGDTTADGAFTLEVARCIGACGLAPAMSVDDVVYKQVHPDKLDLILDRYRKEDERHAG